MGHSIVVITAAKGKTNPTQTAEVRPAHGNRSGSAREA
jgi:hypothetical protein